jgi:hypothetical protein
VQVQSQPARISSASSLSTNIRHFGAPINFDGSCPEAFGKEIVKHSAFQREAFGKEIVKHSAFQRSISTEHPDFLNEDS